MIEYWESGSRCHKRQWVAGGFGATLCARTGRVPASKEDSLFTKEKEALAKARRREKCCWELRDGVSQ